MPYMDGVEGTAEQADPLNRVSGLIQTNHPSVQVFGSWQL
jgi:hypothetical protein